jgi:hypothetical protein
MSDLNREAQEHSMNSSHRRILVVAAAALVLIGTRAVPGQGQVNAAVERFTAFAVNMSGPGRLRSDIVDLVVARWSTESERDGLIDVLLAKGPDALLDTLRKTRRVGFIRTPNSIGYALRYAQNIPGEDGGRRVILVTDRPIGLWEAANQPRSIDYPFTLIELRLNADGEGEGKMSIATKITGNRERGLIELEDYASQPVRLLSVRAAKPPTS